MDKNSNRPTIILVLGMHRSGTSLVAQMAAKWGAYMGNDLMPASKFNQDGHWEHKALVNLNEKILAYTGNTWYAPPAKINAPHLLEVFGDEARSLVEQMDKNQSDWCWKDPRMAILLPFWHEILTDRKLVYIYSYRNPLAVAASLKTRDNIPSITAIALWEIYTRKILEALQPTDACFFAQYEKLIDEPDELTKQLFSFLNAAFNEPKDSNTLNSMRMAIKPNLKHAMPSHNISIDEQQKELYELVKQEKIPEQREKDWLTRLEFAYEISELYQKGNFYKEQNLQVQLFFKDKDGKFSEKNSISKTHVNSSSQIIFEFDNNLSHIESLRFDPLNDWVMCWCNGIDLYLNNEHIESITLSLHNATKIIEGNLFFATNDPQLYFKLNDEKDVAFNKAVIHINYLKIGSLCKSYFAENIGLFFSDLLPSKNATVSTNNSVNAIYQHLSENIDLLKSQAHDIEFKLKAKEKKALETNKKEVHKMLQQIDGLKQELEAKNNTIEEQTQNQLVLNEQLKVEERKRKEEVEQLEQKMKDIEKQHAKERQQFEKEFKVTNTILNQLMANERRKLVQSYKLKLPLRLIGNLIRLIKTPKHFKQIRRDTLVVRRSGLFDDSWYLSQYPDLQLTTVDMLQHYMLHGWKEGRNPNPHFEGNYYLRTNPDVRAAGVNPLVHFICNGWNEGRRPNESFDPRYYIETNYDVKELGINPLQHYIQIGKKEGRETSFEDLMNLSIFSAQNTNIEKKPINNKSAAECIETNLKIAVVFHLYHTDIINECLDYICNIPYKFDLFVTTSLQENNAALIEIRKIFPDVKMVFCPNKGRDIGAFIKAWPLISSYDLCCKLHTKKGDSSYIRIWRDLCLSGILGDKDLVKSIVQKFESNRDLALVGAEQLYASYNAFIGNNAKNSAYLTKNYSIPSNNFPDNGFIMGTMFWMRTDKYAFISNLKHLEFADEAGLNDGCYEHALERLLGSFPLQADDKIGLTRFFQDNSHSVKVVNANYQTPIKKFHNHFNSFAYSHKFRHNIQGNIDNNDEYDISITGWLALIGNETPREAILRINNELDIDIIANIYRLDLERHNKNKGFHCFKTTLPDKYYDGRLLDIILIDKISGQIIDEIFLRKKCPLHINTCGDNLIWNKKREDEFFSKLKELKRLKKENFNGLVSVVMPTYNRANIIGTAIKSVLNQTYNNFELIIIDDCSTDHTKTVISSFKNDKRIKYKKIKKGGVSAARNMGLKTAKGTYVFYLDSDNEWHENYLQTMVDYLFCTNLDSAYCGLEAINDNNETEYFLGYDFSWRRLKRANFIDLNSFGHKRLKNSPILFNEKLKRLVDWDFILNFSKNHTISFLPFLGVKYYHGNNIRITNYECQKPEELLGLMQEIRIKYDQIIQPEFELGKDLSHHQNTDNPKSSGQTKVYSIITSYNHEKYIAQAIESALAQSGDFIHEIIISDDGSTDNTPQIIKAYTKKYPTLISNISRKNNVGVSMNMKRCFAACGDHYIAILEGDDYWTDTNKLQKQVQFLNENQDCSMVFSKIELLDMNSNHKSILTRQENINKEKLDGNDFMADPNLNLIANFSSCLFRSYIIKSMPSVIYETRVNEITIAFYFEQYGKIGYINEPMSVYRIHSNGVWSGKSRLQQLQSGLDCRRMTMAICDEKYKDPIAQIANKFNQQIADLQKEQSQFLTKEKFFNKVNKLDIEYWNVSYEQRWDYMLPVLEEIQQINPSSAIEIGTMGISLMNFSHSMDIDQAFIDIDNRSKMYLFDARITPWDIPDKSYDLFVALQVLEHMEPNQVEVFREIKRIAKKAIITLPYKWSNVPENDLHYMVDEDKINL